MGRFYDLHCEGRHNTATLHLLEEVKVNHFTRLCTWLLPIHRKDQTMHSLQDSLMFSIIDANRHYWQVQLDDSDCNKSAFALYHALGSFAGIPFGMFNAPDSFQQTMNSYYHLSSGNWPSYILTNVVSQNVDKHISHFRPVLLLLHKSGVSFNLKKCKFFTCRIAYLGHVIYPGELELANSTTIPIQDLDALQNATELISFLS